MKSTRYNFSLASAIFVDFLVTTITGFLLWLAIPHQLECVFMGFSRNALVSAHICLIVAGLAGIDLHIFWHWDWLKALRGRRLDEMSKQVRANRLIDRIMWLTFITTNGFGVIAWVLHYGDQVYLARMPDRLHVFFSVVFTVLMIVHIVLHWKRIAFSTLRCIQINVGIVRELQISKTFEQGLRLQCVQETWFKKWELMKNIKTMRKLNKES
jgi:hypothetical protein